MRIVRGEAERAIDPSLELLGDDVLEPVGLVVDVLDVDAERLREVELEQPVVADHLERHALAGRRQRDGSVRLVRGELERCELLHHRARRGGRHPLPAGERGDRSVLSLAPELVDLLEVILDRVGQGRLRHSGSV